MRLREAAVWRALRKPMRLHLLEAVRATGGITAQQLAKRFGITSQLMLYHLQLLEKAGLLAHERGKRSRGKGGKFRCTDEGLSLAVDPRDARERRRLDAILAAMDAQACERRDPTHELRHDMRWESLTAAEVREIERGMGEVRAVLERAAARRTGTDDVPDATHVVMLSLRRALPGVLPARGFTCRAVGRRAR